MKILVGANISEDFDDFSSNDNCKIYTCSRVFNAEDKNCGIDVCMIQFGKANKKKKNFCKTKTFCDVGRTGFSPM